MKFTISNDSTPEELGKMEYLAVKAGREDLKHLAYGVRMARDANAVKDPISKADRFNLATNAFQEAVIEAQLIKMSTGETGPLNTATEAYLSFKPQYEELTKQCFDVYHKDRLAVLAKTKSGKQQLKSTRVTLKALSKLEARYETGALQIAYGKLVQFWHDQELLLSQYDET